MLLRVAVLCLITAAIAGCGAGEGEPASGPAAFGGGPRLEAEMRSADGDPIGTVVMEAGPTGYLLSVTLRGLAPGPHGIHIHEVGTCSPDFGASGGHINPDGRQHGLLNPDGPDNGDLPNIFAGEDGTVRRSYSPRGRTPPFSWTRTARPSSFMKAEMTIPPSPSAEREGV